MSCSVVARRQRWQSDSLCWMIDGLITLFRNCAIVTTQNTTVSHVWDTFLACFRLAFVSATVGMKGEIK